MSWLAERLRDAAAWPINLIRDFPCRLWRLVVWLGQGVTGLAAFGWALGRAKPGGWSLWGRHWGGRLVFAGHQLVGYLFDLVGGPELAQFLMHLVMPTTALTVTEMHAAATVLGPTALRYGDVRVAEGGVLPLIFRLNKSRAFALWHTIHLPERGRADLSLLVHEITHVFQYEKIGSIYIGEALYAQWTLGRGAYLYGGTPGLKQAHHEGKPYKAYTREQQAQIAQDYYLLITQATCPPDQSAIYEPYIQGLRKGEF
ncbi:MAG: hypothetical protein IPL78_10540 [Chloroflexi bacterium]|nr:hypothetical protein [Chloroflexota bacterium]